MFLSIIAAQGTGQLQAIRSSGGLHNVILLENNYDIVQNAFNGNNCLSYTAKSLYYSLYWPLNPGFDYLFRIARRCNIAKELAVALAAPLQKAHDLSSSKSEPTGNRFDQASHDQFIRNIQPYMVALAHFFGCLHDEYANRNIEISILISRYNRETVYRTCGLFYMLKLSLKQILDQELDDAFHGTSTIVLDMLLRIAGTRYTDCIDVFVFSGLEAVKDIMVQPTLAHRLSIAEDHFAKAFPDSLTRTHALPRSILPEIDCTAAVRICRLLPPRRFQFLDLDHLHVGGFPLGRCSRKQELNRFYEHLVTGESSQDISCPLCSNKLSLAPPRTPRRKIDLSERKSHRIDILLVGPRELDTLFKCLPLVPSCHATKESLLR